MKIASFIVTCKSLGVARKLCTGHNFPLFQLFNFDHDAAIENGGQQQRKETLKAVIPPVASIVVLLRVYAVIVLATESGNSGCWNKILARHDHPNPSFTIPVILGLRRMHEITMVGHQTRPLLGLSNIFSASQLEHDRA